MSRSADTAPPVSLRGLAVVGIRLLALYLVAEAIIVVAWSVGGSVEREAVVAPLLLPLVLAAGLWFGVGPIAGAMVPARRAVDPGTGGAGSPGTLVFAAVGLFLLVDALPPLLSAHLALPLGTSEYASLLQPALRLGLGLAVFIGARGLNRVHLWLRFSGRAPG